MFTSPGNPPAIHGSLAGHRSGSLLSPPGVPRQRVFKGKLCKSSLRWQSWGKAFLGKMAIKKEPKLVEETSILGSWNSHWLSKTIHACRNPQYKMHMGGVGWGGAITFMFTCTLTSCYARLLFSCACTHIRDATLWWGGVGWGNNVHVHFHTDVMLR